MKAAAFHLPEIVVLPTEQPEQVVATFESVLGVLPEAQVHLARIGIPALDATTDLLAAAGIDVLDVTAASSFDEVLTTVDRQLGGRRWLHLFGGEQLTSVAAEVLRAGGQLQSAPTHLWLGDHCHLSGPRVRRNGAVARAEDAVEIGGFTPTGSWVMLLGQQLHALFASADEIVDDVAFLVELGQHDAAFQRAELAWRGVEGPHQVELARLASQLALVLGINGAALEAAATWFAAEPEAHVAYIYAQLGLGHVPFPLLDRLLAMVPVNTDIVVPAEGLFETMDRVQRFRLTVDRQRFLVRRMYDTLLRMFVAGRTSPFELGRAFEAAFLLGKPSRQIVRALRLSLPDKPDPATGDGVPNVIGVDFLAEVLRDLLEEFGRAAWVVQLGRRLLMVRGSDLADELDQLGVTELDHWSVIAALDILTPEQRAKTRERMLQLAVQRAGAAPRPSTDENERVEVAAR